MMKAAIRHRRTTVDLGTLPEGDAGIAATVAVMQALVDHAVHVRPSGPVIAKLASNLSRDGTFLPNLWTWCRENVQFQRDPRRVEFVRHPGVLLGQIARGRNARGDCDDLATLGCCIIAAAGLTPVLITVGKLRGGRFQHVFFGARLTTLTKAGVYPLDPQEQVPPGVWPEQARRIKLWSLTVTPPGVTR